MLDKLLFWNNNETTRLRRYKNLLHQPRHQISRLHLRNNPYREAPNVFYGSFWVAFI